ncbi:hypothetical protein SARC_09743, partial [Sphaeroforma arctica JP610]
RVRLDEEVVLITGGAGGLGKSIAQHFGALGATVVLWDHNLSLLAETRDQLKNDGIKVEAVFLDLRDKDSIKDCAEHLQKRRDVTVLVNNAGVASVKPLLELTDEQISSTFDVNVLSHFHTVRAFLPAMMRRQKGHIITIASVLSHIGARNLTDYCSSKAAVSGFHEALAVELSVTAPAISTTIVKAATLTTAMFEGTKTPPGISAIDPEDVARAIVDTVLAVSAGCSTTLILPALFYTWPVYAALPTGVKVWLMHITGAVQSLSDVTGTQ